MSYQSLIPLIKKTKSSLTPEQFQERVNVIFHNHEAAVYDMMHQNMWGSLQEQIDLLIHDLFLNNNIPNHLKLLDIGCGTGLSSQMLLTSKLGSHIDSVTLLDTSPKMLEQAEAKAENWNKPFKTVNGYVIDLEDTFDVIIISSVLHHIPELDVFLKQVDERLNPNGILIHLQDPNGDYLDDQVYLDRKKTFRNDRKLKLNKEKTWTYYIKRIIKKIKKIILGRKSLLDRINAELIAEKVIVNKMSMSDIWSVTDIHVETEENYKNKGISFEFLKKQLSNYHMLGHRSYCFYGELKSELHGEFKENESLFINEGQLNGRNLSGVWMKSN